MAAQTEQQWQPLAVLTVGFVVIAAGLFSAHRQPAAGYEVSIYRATPTSFWLACAVALAIAIGVVAAYRQFTRLPLLLAGLTVFSIVSLPLVRGYHYYGNGDGLTHLGWTREIAAGGSPFELFYPGAHLVATAVHALGFDLRHSMLLVTPLFVLLFLVFVPLTVRTVVSDRAAVVVGAFAAMLLLPIFNFGTSYMFVPYTFAMLFSSFVLYLLVRHVFTPTDELSSWSVAATGALLTVASATLILLHSQLMADVLVLFGAVSFLQIVYRRLLPDHPISNHRTVLGQTVVLAALFTVWNLHYGLMLRVLDAIVAALFRDTDGGVAATVGQRSSSLSEAGASLGEIGAKLLLVNSVFTVVAVLLVAAVLLGRSSRLSDRSRYLTGYLGIGGIVLLPLFLLHFTGVSSSFFFRHVGFGMVLVTVIGSIGLYHLGTTYWVPGGWPTASVLTGVALVLALLVVFPSPYIYLATPHVTQAQMDGYEQTFETSAPDVQYAGIRYGPGRFSSASQEVSGASGGRIDAVHAANVNSSNIDDGIATAVDRDTYLVVTEADRDRELDAYRGVRYDEADFEAVARQRNVSRISSNGQFTLYYVRAEE